MRLGVRSSTFSTELLLITSTVPCQSPILEGLTSGSVATESSVGGDDNDDDDDDGVDVEGIADGVRGANRPR